MAFDEIQFPPEISYGASGGPSFSTTVVELATGAEQRNQNWSRAKGRWTVGHNLKFDTELAVLIAFFRSRRGRARGFRFKDWADYNMADQDIGDGDGATLAFQIIKIYEDSENLNAYTRLITKPVDGTVVVKAGTSLGTAVTLVESTDYTVDYTTGIITFEDSSKPLVGENIYVTCEFDTPARFDTDTMDVTLEAFDANTWGGIPIVELREDTTT